MTPARAHVSFSGRVQGVGFRYTARVLARGYTVTGWVRNLRDGTVELEAQGDKPDVESYLERLRSEMRHHISEARISWVGTEPGDDGFNVRF